MDTIPESHKAVVATCRSFNIQQLIASATSTDLLDKGAYSVTVK